MNEKRTRMLTNAYAAALNGRKVLIVAHTQHHEAMMDELYDSIMREEFVAGRERRTNTILLNCGGKIRFTSPMNKMVDGFDPFDTLTDHAVTISQDRLSQAMWPPKRNFRRERQ